MKTKQLIKVIEANGYIHQETNSNDDVRQTVSIFNIEKDNIKYALYFTHETNEVCIYRDAIPSPFHKIITQLHPNTAEQMDYILKAIQLR